MSGDVLIEIEDVRRHFTVGKQTVRALDGICLTAERGEFLGIAGPSGSGKSTLLYILGGLDRPTSGSVCVAGQDISTLDEDGLSEYRQQKIGFIFQMFNLIPTMTAVENVEFPMLFMKSSTAGRKQRAQQLLEQVGLQERMNHRPTELSGGQQQRVAIARALANDPAMILADEPTGNLDTRSSAEVMNLLHTLNASGATIVMVTHEPDIAMQSQRVVCVRDGKVVTDGSDGASRCLDRGGRDDAH